MGTTSCFTKLFLENILTSPEANFVLAMLLKLGKLGNITIFPNVS